MPTGGYPGWTGEDRLARTARAGCLFEPRFSASFRGMLHSLNRPGVFVELHRSSVRAADPERQRDAGLPDRDESMSLQFRSGLLFEHDGGSLGPAELPERNWRD